MTLGGVGPLDFHEIFHEPPVNRCIAMPGASSNSTFEISNSPCHAGDYATVKAGIVAGEVAGVFELTTSPHKTPASFSSVFFVKRRCSTFYMTYVFRLVGTS